VAADQDQRGRPCRRRSQAAQPVRNRGGHHRHGKSHRSPDRQPALRDGPSLLGDAVAEGRLRAQPLDRLDLVARLLRQTPKSTGKLYALHEPEVDCIAKGKARVRYEFGTKVSIATTLAEGVVVGLRSMPGNP
jgi:hypothetical protein